MKNFFKLLVFIVSCSFTANVLAANTTISASSCNNGVVNTYYFYYFEAIGSAELQNTTLSAHLKVRPTTSINTEFYTPKALVGTTLNDLLYNPSNYNVAQGNIPIVSGSTSFPNQKNLDEFWIEHNKTLNTSNYYRNDSTSNTWYFNSRSKNQFKFDDEFYNAYSLSSASILTKPTMNPSLSSDTNYSVISLTPNYSNATDIRGNTDFSAIDDELEATVDGITDNYTFIPSLYYIQFCQKVGTTNEPNTGTGSNTNNTFTITYNDNMSDAVVEVPEAQTTTNGNIKISSYSPMRDGYSFYGWHTNPNAKITDSGFYHASVSYTITSSLNLYAIWINESGESEDIHKITYNPNTTDTVVGMPTVNNVFNGVSTTISNYKPTRTDYTFLGWSTNPNATTADSNYAPGITFTPTNDLTLYAIWQRNGDEVPNPNSGIKSYLITFGIISLIAGGTLVYTNRQKLFKQM